METSCRRMVEARCSARLVATCIRQLAFPHDRSAARYAVLKDQELRDAGVERKRPGSGGRSLRSKLNQQSRFIDFHGNPQSRRHLCGLRERIKLQRAMVIIETERELEQKIHAQHAANLVVQRSELRKRYS